jgi:hypothetical protein
VYAQDYFKQRQKCDQIFRCMRWCAAVSRVLIQSCTASGKGTLDAHGFVVTKSQHRGNRGRFYLANKGIEMTFKQTLFSSLAAASMVAGVAGHAMARDVVIVHNLAKPGSDGMAPKYAVIKHLNANVRSSKPASFPPTWTYSLVYSGKTYPEVFIGTNPTTGTSTTIPVYLVPVKMVYGSTSYDPSTLTANGVSIVQNVINSPVFTGIDFKVNGVDFGTTQYVDAFQRSDLWSTVSTHTGWHTLLGKPTVAASQTVTIPTKNGKIISAFGATNLILANINTYDAKIQALISSLGIPSTSLPLFITAQTYWSSNNSTSGCCIGGYHSVTSSTGQPYATSTYITTSGAFAQNTGALSHEIGEWMTDPNVDNAVPAACGSGAVLEVGDPLEGNTNYGDYAYTAATGVTYDLQDLAEVGYFGATPNPSASGYTTFQGESLPFCSNGG